MSAVRIWKNCCQILHVPTDSQVPAIFNNNYLQNMQKNVFHYVLCTLSLLYLRKVNLKMKSLTVMSFQMTKNSNYGAVVA